jgi:hypothetical protein
MRPSALRHRRLPRPPHVNAIHRGLRALPSAHQATRPRDPLQILVTCPQHQRGLDIFSAQALENSQRERAVWPRIAASPSCRTSKRALSATASTTVSAVIGPGVQQQRELLDLLVRRQQIAFDALGEQRRAGAHRPAACTVRAARGSMQGRRGRSIGHTCTRHPALLDCTVHSAHPASGIEAWVQ